MRELVAKEKGVRGLPINVRNAFDLYLYRFSKTSNYQLIVFMKLQFFFYNNEPHCWTEEECYRFAAEWDYHVKEAWGNKVLMELAGGEKVYLNFDFKIQLGGWMLDHWELNVTKIAQGAFRVSSVRPDLGQVNLDSEDLQHITGQRGAVHEFGHMLGLDDEYDKREHFHDFASVMHSAGEMIRDRHLHQFKRWVLHQLGTMAV